MAQKHGTIKIPKQDFERHNERRQELGVTWANYLDGQAPEPWHDFAELEAVSGGIEGLDYDRIREVVREETRRALEEVQR